MAAAERITPPNREQHHHLCRPAIRGVLAGESFEKGACLHHRRGTVHLRELGDHVVPRGQIRQYGSFPPALLPRTEGLREPTGQNARPVHRLS